MELWAKWTSECQKINILLFPDGTYEVRIGDETVRTGALHQPIAEKLMQDLIRQKYFVHQTRNIELKRSEL